MIKNILHKIRKNEFYKNTLTLFGGLIVAQIIPLAVAPVLTRIYSIELFGIFFIYSAIVVITSIFASLQYEITVVLPKEDSDAVNLLVLSILTCIGTSVFIFIVIFFLSNRIAFLLGNSKIEPWLYLVPLSILFTGIFQSFNYFGNRFKKYKSISNARVIKSTVTAISQMPAGIFSYQKFGLIYGLIFGQIVSAFYIFLKFYKKAISLRKNISLNRILQLAGTYKNVPVYNTLMGLQNRLSGYLPFFLLGNYYGITIVSLYGLANRIVSTPTGIISQSIGQVFYQRASEIYNKKENLHVLVKNLYIKLFKIAIIPFTVLFFTAPFLFKFIFGPEWEQTGKIIRLILPWLFLLFLNTPITSIITILNRQKVLVVYNTFLLIFRFTGLYIGYKWFSDEYYSIMFYSMAGFVFNFGILFYMLRISRVPYSR